ncbi:MAG: hypothetical protein AAB690_02500, partial [Patescibacteria group bacterium]
MKMRFAILGLTLLLIPFFVGAAVPAEIQVQIESTKRERDTLLEEQKRLEAELDALNKESQTIGTAVKSLDATRKKLVNDINITKSKITSSNLSIRSLESTIGDKERQIIVHEQAIA